MNIRDIGILIKAMLRTSYGSIRRGMLISLMLHIGISAGCLQELPDVTTVSNLRILAIQAEPPEVGPGDEVRLEILVADVSPGPYQLEWYLCAQPERGFGFSTGSTSSGASGGQGYGLDGSLSCIEAGQRGLPNTEPLGTNTSVRVQIADDLFTDTELLAELYGLPPTIPPSVFTLLNSIAGVNLTVAVRIQKDGEIRDAYKRINVSAANDSNSNPAPPLLHITPEGSDEATPTNGEYPGLGRCFLRERYGPIIATPGEYRLTPVNIPKPHASYSILFITPDSNDPVKIEQREEEYFFSFFTNRGELGSAIVKSSSDGGTSLTIPPTGPDDTDLWVVVRDGRGGTNWCHSRLHVQPLD